MTPLKRFLPVAVAMMAIGVGLMISGCVTSEQVANANYGNPPSDPQGRILKYLHHTLKDPESARIEWGPMYRGYVAYGLLTGKGTEYGHIQTLRVNAKNGFGAYTGWQTHYIMFINEYFVGDVTANILVGKMGGIVGDPVRPAPSRPGLAL